MTAAMTELARTRAELKTALMHGKTGRLADDRTQHLIDAHQAALKAAYAERRPDELAKVMQIVSEYVTASNDFGGLDANDLAFRLEQAGHPLPEVDEDDI